MKKIILAASVIIMTSAAQAQMPQGEHAYSNEVLQLKFMLSEDGREIVWAEVIDKAASSIIRGQGEWHSVNSQTVDPSYDGPEGWYQFEAGGFNYEFEEPKGKALKLTRSRDEKSEKVYNLRAGTMTASVKKHTPKVKDAATASELSGCKKAVLMEYSNNSNFEDLLEKNYTRKMIRLICKGMELDEFGISNLQADYRTDLQDGSPDSVKIADAIQQGEFVVVRVDLVFLEDKYQKFWKFQKEDGKWLICDILTQGHNIDEQNGSLANFLQSLR
jgi:hypothetical protein